MDHFEVVVVGAGVVGLAIARQAALQGQAVVLLEKEPSFGMSTSSRNSEVIHAGIYYPENSLKAKYCVLGNRLLYAYLQERGLAFKNYGKLIVASNSSEQDKLEKIWLGAKANGVTQLERLTQAQLGEIEPALSAFAGIYSGTTGVVDSHALMLSLLGDFENAGGVVSYQTHFLGAQMAHHPGNFQVTYSSRDEPERLFQFSCDYVINAAGLGAIAVAKTIAGLDAQYIPQAYFVKGNYFSLTGKTPFRHLIYPIPEEVGLGVHLTLDLNGRAKFGPDVEHIDTQREEEINYAVNPERSNDFEAHIRRYWPTLPTGALSPDYSGVRPKIKYGGQVYKDFKISTEQEHHVPGLINLFGFESPGLTAALAIGEDLGQRLIK